MTTSTPTPLHAYVPTGRFPTPPTEEEKFTYLRGGQKRWMLVVQYLAFVGVIISFAGFATSSYWTLIFGFPLVLLILEETIALFTSTRRRQVTLADHRSLVELWAPEHYPSVDVFLPTAGEDLDVLANTLKYLGRMEWPGELRVSVLDDRGRPAVRELTGRHGFSYIARPGNEFNKAGNLRYAADRTNGDIIAILDADFVPRAEYLAELVPYMDDPTIGIVQSAQYFDTTKSMNWVQRCSGATQELFYRFLQPSRDRAGAAICVGTSAIYRRSALDATGGFPKIGHSEDIYTSFEMAKLGLTTRYVPVIVSKGICPTNIDSFIAQQFRWCEGSVSMLFSRDFHVNETMTLTARLSYWAGFLYYIGTAIGAIVIPLPAVIMSWFYPHWVRPWNTVWLIGALVMWVGLYPLVMRGRWRIEVLRLQTVCSFAHLFSTLDVILQRATVWHPTGSKSSPVIARKVKRFYTVYLGFFLTVLAAGLALRSLELGFVRFAGMLVFFALNLYVIGPLVTSGIRDEYRLRRPRRSPAAQLSELPQEVVA